MADLHTNGPIPSSQHAAGVNTPAGVLFVSASRTAAAYNSDEQFNPNCKGIRLFTTNDAAGGSTATVKIQVKDPVGDTWTDLAGATTLALGAVTGSITTIYPGLTGIADAAGITINQHLGCVWRAVLTIGVATGTASVGAEYLL
jgi:hypothetical protein